MSLYERKNPWEAYLPSILELLKFAAESKPLPQIEKSERGQLVRDLYDHWVTLGGRNAGHPIRSVRQMKEWLGPDNVIRSLEPKLSGRTNLGRDDAKILFELFLSQWHQGDRLGEEKPYHDTNISSLTSGLLEILYPEHDKISSKGLLLPDRRSKSNLSRRENDSIHLLKTREIQIDLFEESDGLITASRRRTISSSPESIRLFQSLIDEWRGVDKKDGRTRILIWIV